MPEPQSNGEQIEQMEFGDDVASDVQKNVYRNILKKNFVAPCGASEWKNYNPFSNWRIFLKKVREKK